MEVATLAGGALLSATFELLFSKLDSFVSEWLNLPEKCRSEMRNWKNLLPKINVLLEDAEEKQGTDRLVKLWLADLKDLVYDMEDILDEVEIDAERFKLLAEAQASTSKPQKLVFPKLFKVARFTAKGDQKMASRMENITDRLRRIEAEISTLNLVNLAMRTGDKSYKVAAQGLPTTSLIENHVCGRQDEKTAILQMLLSDEGKHEPYSIIPIVGMGGLGKTTLARLVYNDEKLKGVFGLKAWVCISEESDIFQITRSISEQVTTEARDFKDLTSLTSLQERLKEKFSGQKFLLVLDDIWDEKYNSWDALWDNLQKPFLSGAFGSKIIITTRDENVGRKMKGDDRFYRLAFLENDACLSLFARRALGAENFDAYPDLKDVGEKIVNKCKGLPLAIKSLSGLLRGKIRRDEWEDISNSKILDLSKDSSGILPALRLSYNHLPSHLKRCFAYCSVFPKDYEFDKDQLVLLWMGEGFVQQLPHGRKKMQDIGHEYFCELLSRAFFQSSSKDESLFVMHDLIVDLSLDIAGETYCTLEVDGKRSEASFQKARHLSLLPCRYEVPERFDSLKKKKNLRTFLSLKNMDEKFLSSKYFLSNTLLQDLMDNLKCLRVLSLQNYSITKVSNSIGDLKHLRFINLSNTEIESLPESVGYLLYLQTLLLRNCQRFSKLPTTIGNLLDLQHLDIAQTPSLKEFPSEISNLTSLVTLSKFIVGNAQGPRVKDLKNLSCLRGQLSVLDLQNVVDANDANEANLVKIEGLDDLSLEWSSDFLNNRNERYEMQVLNWLKPYQGLKRLTINCFGGLKFPPWIGDSSFSKLEFLKLNNCQKSTSLPSLERLPQLKELIITGMHVAETMMLEFDGGNSSSTQAFPSLESLELQDCPLLLGKFPKCIPSLKNLKISRCPELKYSAVSLPSLEELNIEECGEAILRSVVELNSLKTLRISRISELRWLPKSFVESLIALEDMEIRTCDELTCLWEEGANIVNLSCLKRMSIKRCPQLVSLTGKEQGFLPNSVQTLSIEACAVLESLPDEIMMLVRLENLCIRGCRALRMFPKGQLPTTLRVLQIERCEKLESLPEGILMNNGGACQGSHLEELHIHWCPCLKSFPSGHLPNSLKRLSVRHCRQLEFIPQRMLQYCTELEHFYLDCGDRMANDSSFRCITGDTTYLMIEDCHGLESFCLSLPNLKSLTIENCRSLKSLPDKLQDLTSLDKLYIKNCPGIESIPDGGLPPSLTTLKISYCAGIKSLPDGGLPPNLTDLDIDNCLGIESIPACGFPPNLTKLQIGCKNLKQPMQEWGLSSLTSLRDFSIYWICLPDDALPTSLTSLSMYDVENMKSMSRGLLRNLNSLQNLSIGRCRKLQSLPKEGLPPSLKNLYIWGCDNFQSLPKEGLPPSLQVLNIQTCPNIQSLPKEGLPPSLEQLWIVRCPLLKRRCLEEKGDYWPLIARIPYIYAPEYNFGSHTSSETKQKLCLCFKTG